jgi:hypothetical protein
VGSNRERGLSSSALSPARPGALRRAGVASIGGAALLALLLSPIKVCLVAALLHVPCPGCGLTRAAIALVCGDFAGAFTLHPLSFALVPLLAAVAAVHVVRYVRTGTALGASPLPRAAEIASGALVVLLIGVWVARLFGFFGGPVAV